MVNASLNGAGLLGIALVLLSVYLLAMRGRQPSQASHSVQDFPLVLAYFIAGLILLFQGWRLDPILQFVQLLLIGSIIYRVVKDIAPRP